MIFQNREKNFLLPINFSNLSFLDPIRLLRCQTSCVNDKHLNLKSYGRYSIFSLLLKASKYWLRIWYHLSNFNLFWEGAFGYFIVFFFFQFLLHSYLSPSFFQQKLMLFGMQYAYSHCEYNGQAIQANI